MIPQHIGRIASPASRSTLSRSRAAAFSATPRQVAERRRRRFNVRRLVIPQRDRKLRRRVRTLRARVITHRLHRSFCRRRRALRLLQRQRAPRAPLAPHPALFARPPPRAPERLSREPSPRVSSSPCSAPCAARRGGESNEPRRRVVLKRDLAREGRARRARTRDRVHRCNTDSSPGASTRPRRFWRLRADALSAMHVEAAVCGGRARHRRRLVTRARAVTTTTTHDARRANLEPRTDAEETRDRVLGAFEASARPRG